MRWMCAKWRYPPSSSLIKRQSDEIFVAKSKVLSIAFVFMCLCFLLPQYSHSPISFQPLIIHKQMKTDGSTWLRRTGVCPTAAPQPRPPDRCDELNESKEAAYQVIIGISGALSIASLLCLCLVMPSLYGYVDTMSSFSIQDFKYCEVSHIAMVDLKTHT